MKILFVIDTFFDGGASKAMTGLIDELIKKDYSIAVFTRINSSSYSKVEIIVGNGEELVNLIKRKDFELIHWFRTNFSTLSHNYIDACKSQKFKSPLIILTFCQVPSSFSFRLSLKELSFFNFFVFICKSAYHHGFHKIIPDNKKTMIYFGTHQIEKITPKEFYKNDVLIFGRGSTLNKCPDDMIEHYLKISEGYKSKFKIAGFGDTSGILSKIEKYNCKDKVELVPHLNDNEWLSFLKGLDIYLYQLPMDSYSAIDATIQDAMLTEIPVVIFGPDAPKELVENGISGFTASNSKEFIEAGIRLAKDPDLRKSIGKRGRQHILDNFAHSVTVQNYISLYDSVRINQDELYEHIKIPFLYRIYYNFDCIKNELTQQIDLFKFRIKRVKQHIKKLYR